MPELLADHTTLRLGGPARAWVRASTEAELVDAVRRADEEGEPVLVLGGGSNVVVADAGFDGTVVEVATSGVHADVADDDPTGGGVVVTVAAGEDWDAFVARAVEHRWVGVESLAGIPGSVGATPIQNVGAYGQEVSQTIASVRVWDRRLRGVRTFAAGDCGFGYRTSRFKADPSRHVVLDVTFQLEQGELGAPVTYAELAGALDVGLANRARLSDVRRAVLRLRASKGMVLDPGDHDTWSAGSFFTNPVVPADRVPDGAPAWPQPDGLVKTSAAW
ncbi:MAG: UDP-N-acetylmuramate dehydrogenase, partial [Nocardioides sp.]